MTEQEIYRYIKSSLLKVGIKNHLDSRVIFYTVFGHNHYDSINNRTACVAEIKLTEELINKRIKGYPLQYIAKSWPFLDFELSVGEGVLIPRPETEDVVSNAIMYLKDIAKPNIIDLCSGTGCIAIALKNSKEDATVTAVELYDEAIEFLKENIKKYSLDIKVEQADVFGYEDKIPNNSVDLIISNPPYVTKDEYLSLEKELYYEPKESLTDNDDGLKYYRYISKEYMIKFKDNGLLIFEVAESRSEEIKDILSELYYGKIEILKDSFGNKRIVSARKCCKCN